MKRPRFSSATFAVAGGAVSGALRGQEQPLLPGLPDDLAQLCLSRLPPSILFSVCRSWRRLLYSPSFPPFLALYALLAPEEDPEPVAPNRHGFNPGFDENPVPISDSGENQDPDPSSNGFIPSSGDDPDTESGHSPSFSGENPIGFWSFDPLSGKWEALPPPPPHPRLLLRHPSFIARPLPVQSAAAAGHLVLLAATTTSVAGDGDLLPAFSSPLVFHPPSRRWRVGPELAHPRRWCAAGAAAGQVFVASGVGPGYDPAVARSAAAWDLLRAGDGWAPVRPLSHGRFSREPVEAVHSDGKICMVNLKGRGAKEGLIYDLRSDRWEKMPPGLVSGWTGPATSDERDGPIFVVDEESGELKRYQRESDTWRHVVVEGPPDGMKGAVAIAAGGGRLCVAGEGGAAVAVVETGKAKKEAQPMRVWRVAPPKGKRVVAVHVLPRMSRTD